MDLDALRTLFLRERDTFAEVYPHVANASLRLKWFKRTQSRDCCLAEVGDDHPVIYIHIDVVDRLASTQLTALVRHELAHACEPDLSEAATDALAEEITGHAIYYGADNIQTTRPGVRPRPPYLPR